LKRLTRGRVVLRGFTSRGFDLWRLMLRSLHPWPLDGLVLEHLSLWSFPLSPLVLRGFALRGFALWHLSLGTLAFCRLALRGFALSRLALRHFPLGSLTLRCFSSRRVSLSRFMLRGFALSALARRLSAWSALEFRPTAASGTLHLFARGGCHAIEGLG